MTPSNDRRGEAGIFWRRASSREGSPAPIEPRPARARAWPIVLAALVLALHFLDRPPRASAPAAAERPASSPAPASPRPEPEMPPEPAATREKPAGCPHGCTEPLPGCEVKGNLSSRTGERIYHVPGQRYYDATVIEPEKGERWFCSEREARANGWRKSRQ